MVSPIRVLSLVGVKSNEFCSSFFVAINTLVGIACSAIRIFGMSRFLVERGKFFSFAAF